MCCKSLVLFISMTCRSNKRALCKPSCIPISIILLLIFLVVLLPLLDHAAEKALQAASQVVDNSCQKKCRYVWKTALNSAVFADLRTKISESKNSFGEYANIDCAIVKTLLVQNRSSWLFSCTTKSRYF